MPWCSSCAKDVSVMATMNESAQLVQSCTECEHRIGMALTPPMAHFDKTTIRALPVGPQRAVENVVPINPQTAKARAGSGAIPTQATTTTEPADAICGVRDRLLYLEAEIAKRAGFEVEAKMLRKMLAVADRVASSAKKTTPPMLG